MWKAITSFLPGATPSAPPAKSFTSAVPAAASVNSKAVSTSATSSIKAPSLSLPSFSGNLKQNVNYTDPKDEETYNLKISKAKFNAGNSNPFFVNVPAKKYKVLVPEDPEVEPTEEITNATLRFYGSSAENVYKKAKTYKTSAKSKHNALFGKAQSNYRSRVTEKAKKAGKNRNLLLQQRAKQEATYRKQISDMNKEISSLLTKLDLAQKKVIPATTFAKSRRMTNDEQKIEVQKIKQRIEQIKADASKLENELKGVTGLPSDIQTVLSEVKKQTNDASKLASKVVPVNLGNVNVSLGTSQANRNKLRKASNASSSVGSKVPTPTPTPPGSPTSTSSIARGFAASTAASKLKASVGSPKAANKKQNTSFLNPLGKPIPVPAPNVSASLAEAEALLQKGAPKLEANAANPPPPIRKPSEPVESPTGNTPDLSIGTPVQATTAAVPNPKAAQPPPVPNSPWLGGGTRRKQKKAKKASRKMKRGSKKH